MHHYGNCHEYNEVCLNGYALLRKDRNRHGGGVAFIIYNTLKFNLRMDLSDYDNYQFGWSSSLRVKDLSCFVVRIVPLHLLLNCFMIVCVCNVRGVYRELKDWYCLAILTQIV